MERVTVIVRPRRMGSDGASAAFAFDRGEKGLVFVRADKRTCVMRRTFSVAALVAFAGSAALLLAPPAMAQTAGYPPTCNPADIPQDAGSHNVGDTFQVRLEPPCVFTPGREVAVSVNGTKVGKKTADASGFVTVTVRAVSATEFSIEDPVSVVARCGNNSAVGNGPSAAAGTNVTQTANFRLVCPGVPGGGPVTPVKGSVAFTGANIAKWAAVALALIGVGAVLVVADRRRGRKA